MTAPPQPAPTNRADPHQDQRAAGADAPSRTGRLLGLVRKLIDYGKQLASTLQQRTAATNLADVTRNFGAIDIAAIISCITRGLLRAAALEARLDRRLAHEPAAPVAIISAPSRRQPRAARAVAQSASAADPSAADPRLALLPTPAEIAAQVRRRPVGAVIADICRDLGIVASHPLWREISMAIIVGGGSLANLVQDIFKRLSTGLLNSLAAAHPAGPAPYPPSAVALGTGPP